MHKPIRLHASKQGWLCCEGKGCSKTNSVTVSRDVDKKVVDNIVICTDQLSA